jgi:hypothetical protein
MKTLVIYTGETHRDSNGCVKSGHKKSDHKGCMTQFSGSGLYTQVFWNVNEKIWVLLNVYNALTNYVD